MNTPQPAKSLVYYHYEAKPANSLVYYHYEAKTLSHRRSGQSPPGPRRVSCVYYSFKAMLVFTTPYFASTTIRTSREIGGSR